MNMNTPILGRAFGGRVRVPNNEVVTVGVRVRVPVSAMNTNRLASRSNSVCPLKTGIVIRKTGRKSAQESGSGPATAVKEVPNTQTAEPKTGNPIPLLEAALFSPSPTLTMSLETASRKTSAAGVSDAISPMTHGTTLKQDEEQGDTGSRRFLSITHEKTRLLAWGHQRRAISTN